jgi:hypothetical protein
MRFDALTGVLLIPAIAAALLAVLPGYRMTARLNVVATTLTFLCALSLFFWSTISMRRSSCSPPSSASPPACSA